MKLNSYSFVWLNAQVAQTVLKKFWILRKLKRAKLHSTVINKRNRNENNAKTGNIYLVPFTLHL